MNFCLLKVVPTYWPLEVGLYIFFVSVLDGGECSFHTVKEPPVPTNRGWVGPRVGLDAMRKRTLLSSYVQQEASHYTDWATGSRRPNCSRWQVSVAYRLGYRSQAVWFKTSPPSGRDKHNSRWFNTRSTSNSFHTVKLPSPLLHSCFYTATNTQISFSMSNIDLECVGSSQIPMKQKHCPLSHFLCQWWRLHGADCAGLQEAVACSKFVHWYEQAYNSCCFKRVF
jgi:hypothetical protein